MIHSFRKSTLIALSVIALSGAARTSAQETRADAKLADAPPGSVRLFVSGGMRAPVLAVMPQLEKATGRKVVIQASESRALQTDIENGQPFEAALLTTTVIKDMIAKGKITAGSDVPIAVVRVGVSVRGTAPRLDVTSPAGLRSAILGAHSVRRYYGVAASTPILDNLFDKLNLNEATKGKIVALRGGSIPSEAPLADGQYELIINLITAIKPMKGWTYLGAIPEKLQMPLRHSIGLGVAGDQALGKKVIAVLESGDFDAALKANGSQRQ
jgi:molybdate transport system substrate-binding protein